MKTTNLLLLAGLMAAMASCATYDAKDARLENMNDSLNYTLGLTNGSNIKNFYLRNDTTGEALREFIDALDQSFRSKSNANPNELYELGKNIGAFLKMQEENGFIGDSTLTFDQKTAYQGLINGLNGHESIMTREVAIDYFQKTLEAARRPQPAAQPAAPEAEEDNHITE